MDSLVLMLAFMFSTEASMEGETPRYRLVNRNRRNQTPLGAVFHPERCMFTQTQHGRLLRSESLDIEVVSLKEPMVAETSALAGMNLPAGIRVVMEPETQRGRMIGNGPKVVSKIELLPT